MQTEDNDDLAATTFPDHHNANDGATTTLSEHHNINITLRQSGDKFGAQRHCSTAFSVLPTSSTMLVLFLWHGRLRNTTWTTRSSGTVG